MQTIGVIIFFSKRKREIMACKLPLLLIPGLAGNKTMWEPQIQGLGDLADCWVAPLPAWDDLGDMAQYILTEAPPRFAVAGWSMGGYLAFEILQRAPERVIKLALMSTTPEPETGEVSKRRRASMVAIEDGGFLAEIRSLSPRFLHPERRRDGVIVELMVRQAFEIGPEAYRQHHVAMMKRPDYRHLLPKIQCPTLVVSGRQDYVTRSTAQARMARGIGRSKLVQLERCAHMVTLERPVETVRAMRQWLRQGQRAMAA
jgi:pimeloyl-ACP methyl ester carboxylesterase